MRSHVIEQLHSGQLRHKFYKRAPQQITLQKLNENHCGWIKILCINTVNIIQDSTFRMYSHACSQSHRRTGQMLTQETWQDPWRGCLCHTCLSLSQSHQICVCGCLYTLTSLLVCHRCLPKVRNNGGTQAVHKLSCIYIPCSYMQDIQHQHTNTGLNIINIAMLRTTTGVYRYIVNS